MFNTSHFHNDFDMHSWCVLNWICIWTTTLNAWLFRSSEIQSNCPRTAIALAPLNFFCKLKRLHLHSDKSISDLTPRSCTFGSGLGLLGTRYLNKIFKKWHFEINNGPVPFHWESYNDIKTNSPLWTNQRMSVSSTYKWSAGCALQVLFVWCQKSSAECFWTLSF